MQYIDNFLPKVLLDRLKLHVEDMSWHFTQTTYPGDVKSFSYLVADSRDLELREISVIVASFVAEEIGKTPDDIMRIRYGLITKNSHKTTIHTKHIDYPIEQKVISTTFYLNDNNGYLYIYNEAGEITEKVKPKENRLVILKENEIHATSTPTDAEERIAVTMNFRS